MWKANRFVRASWTAKRLLGTVKSSRFCHSKFCPRESAKTPTNRTSRWKWSSLCSICCIWTINRWSRCRSSNDEICCTNISAKWMANGSLPLRWTPATLTNCRISWRCRWRAIAKVWWWRRWKRMRRTKLRRDLVIGWNWKRIICRAWEIRWTWLSLADTRGRANELERMADFYWLVTTMTAKSIRASVKLELVSDVQSHQCTVDLLVNSPFTIRFHRRRSAKAFWILKEQHHRESKVLLQIRFISRTGRLVRTGPSVGSALCRFVTQSGAQSGYGHCEYIENFENPAARFE